MGKGNKPNSGDPLTDEEIEQLYSEGVLGVSGLITAYFLECGLRRNKGTFAGEI